MVDYHFVRPLIKYYLCLHQKSLEKIKFKNYFKIGKRPLSLLLGWGEQTFSRYCDGDMPTKQYSDILKRIYEDPIYYLSVLEDNKDRLKSMISYEKSKATTMNFMENNEKLNPTKIDSVINCSCCSFLF